MENHLYLLMEGKKIFSDLALVGDDLEIWKNVSIEVSEEGIIGKVTKEDEEFHKKSKNQRTILIPGLINSHTHVVDNFGKEMGLNKPIKNVVSGLNSIKYTILKNYSQNQKAEGIKYAINEMLSYGITYFIDFRENGLYGANLLLESTKETPIGLKILGRPDNNDDLIDVFNLTDGLGFPSCSDIDTIQLKKILDENSRDNKIIATHISEVKREKLILEELLNNNLIDVFIHGTHFIEEDLIKIKNKNKKLVICPQSNGYFGTGIPPIREILDNQLDVSIGTDNLMAIRPDLFEELRFLFKISKLKNQTYVVESKELLKMVTINAAKNFNLENERGSISEGKVADFFLIDLNYSNYYTIEKINVLDLIVHRTISENIKKVFIKGKVAFERQ